ncbi:hypothetical protein ACFTXJ_32000 [Streptomyces zhihengii]|uniref:hypothetical protein n=1 Tax=Streptomyces zhihengii TaxID=1818004 RepID=UPI0036359482
MFGLTKRDAQTIFVRDSDGVTAALREALAEAPPEERPGLEGALEIAGGVCSSSEAETQARWVRAHLDAAAVTGPADSVTAIKALREAAPGMSLLAAVELARTTRTVEDARGAA